MLIGGGRGGGDSKPLLLLGEDTGKSETVGGLDVVIASADFETHVTGRSDEAAEDTEGSPNEAVEDLVIKLEVTCRPDESLCGLEDTATTVTEDFCST